MVLYFSRTILAAFMFFIIINSGHAQESNKRLIIGTWSFKKMELLRVFDDSVAMKEQGVGGMVTFLDSVTVVSKKETAKGIEIKDSGTYRISADGRILSQHDTKAEIVKLTERELIFRVEGVFILYFERRDVKFK
ncbi:hypothetical protein [Lacibacter sp.]|uniref:hypothetical protein n=1 Tax=Lacibacter sp. TaxID=1915409 RepID=UPI002B4B13BA|nr:hypothetical protein [Lacibacter sp.]HLP39546.1 hypothetical protein [Lacibacter sp.]